MKTQELVSKLVESCSAHLLSDVRPAPVDIDLYVPPENLATARKMLVEEGFVLTSDKTDQIGACRFEDGTLYILDLFSNFNIYTAHLPFMKVSAQGSAVLGSSGDYYRCFKALCLGSRSKLSWVEERWPAFAPFLDNKDHFNRFSSFLWQSRTDPPRRLMARYYFYSLPFRFVEIARHYLKRFGKGRSLAFIGPDGSGKSFFINKLRDIGPTSVVYMGDWFFTFQKFYTFLTKNIPSPWNRFLYIFYFFENIVRQIKISLLRVSGRIVLIDRFPGTNRNLANKGFLFFLNQITFRFFPKPDELILLIAPPETIHQRKQELSVQEIGTLQDQLRHFLAGTRHRVINTQELDKSLNALLGAAYHYKEKA